MLPVAQGKTWGVVHGLLMLQKKVVPSAQLHFIGQTESRAAAKVESREDRDVPTCPGRAAFVARGGARWRERGRGGRAWPQHLC